MEVRGPAAGHAKLRTSADPTGRRVRGTLNNCAGGVTPWGTVLIGEENFDRYFWGSPDKAPNAAELARYRVARDPLFGWGRIGASRFPAFATAELKRFSVDLEPHEPNRFGWMVELDPYHPERAPIKRTALGRLKHEGADVIVSAGRAVAYTGDDERFEYLYRYVSDGEVRSPGDPANAKLLDEGTLSVARFHASGTLSWIPLVFGRGPLGPENGFADQGDVLIQCRRAADLVQATPLDRPEDVQVDPRTGRVYAMLTNNTARTPERVDAANPRPKNAAGHVLELVPPGGEGDLDHTSPVFGWNVYLLGGEDVDGSKDPRVATKGSVRAKDLRCPDNCAFDPWGRLWIATDGAPDTYAEDVPAAERSPDGLWAIDVDEQGNRTAMLFYACPVGAEPCGPCFTPDGETLFVAVQHPGEESSYEEPSTHWPRSGAAADAGAGARPGPPRPAVVAITRARPGADAAGFDARIGC
jgi:secreted PhoX family phosphatase